MSFMRPPGNADRSVYKEAHKRSLNYLKLSKAQLIWQEMHQYLQKMIVNHWSFPIPGCPAESNFKNTIKK